MFAIKELGYWIIEVFLLEHRVLVHLPHLFINFGFSVSNTFHRTLESFLHFISKLE